MLESKAHAEYLRTYAAHADHPHAPEICRQARILVEQFDLFAEPPQEPTPPPLVLEPSIAEPDEPELDLVVAPVVDTDQFALFAADELQPVQAPAEPVQSIYVHFEDLTDLEAFGRLIGQPVTTQTRLIKFPIDENHFRAWRAANGVEQPTA